MLNGFSIGPLYIHFYGIIIMVGVLAGTWVAYREAIRLKQNVDVIWDMLIWILIGGIVGARIWHILTPPPSMVKEGITTLYYLTHPLDALAIWNGGLGIPGAIVGGALALFLFTRRHHLTFLLWLDAIAPGVALGQAIGRWGNFVNQELYGAPTHLPWAIYIDPSHRLPGYESQAYYHPLFLYESLWDLANLVFLLWVRRRFSKRLYSGDVFLIYTITYPVGRFLFEFLRLDASQIGGINANQTLMLIIFIISGLTLLWRHRRSRKIGVPVPEG